MSSTLIRQATIVNEGKRFIGDLLIENGVIKSISSTPISTNTDVQVVNAQGLYLLPGLIDAHVHFREPGLTQKGDIHSESSGRWCHLFHGHAQCQTTNDITWTLGAKKRDSTTGIHNQLRILSGTYQRQYWWHTEHWPQSILCHKTIPWQQHGKHARE